MEQSFKKGVVLNLASLVEYSEGGVISRQLIKSPAGNVTPANAPHALIAVEKFKMLLTMIRE